MVRRVRKGAFAGAGAGKVFAIPRLDLKMTFIAASLSEIKGIALLEVGSWKLDVGRKEGRQAAVCTESEHESRGGEVSLAL